MPHAYINTGSSSGRRNVFRRARADAQFNALQGLLDAGVSDQLVGRYPTLIRYGPSVAGAMQMIAARKAMTLTARTRWDRELEAQLRHFLRQRGLLSDG